MKVIKDDAQQIAWVVASFSADKSIKLYKNLLTKKYFCSEGKIPNEFTTGEDREEAIQKFKILLKQQIEKGLMT